jgi:DNA-binding MarR family transcriptional regulator
MSRLLGDEIREGRPLAGPQQEAFLSLGRTWAALEHALSEMLRPYGITTAQYQALRILRCAGGKGLCRGEVQERLIAMVPDVTRLLDRMESNGWIVREREVADRRFVSARVTGRGVELLDRLEEPVQALHRRHFAGLDEAELRGLIDVLGRVRQSV